MPRTPSSEVVAVLVDLLREVEGLSFTDGTSDYGGAHGVGVKVGELRHGIQWTDQVCVKEPVARAALVPFYAVDEEDSPEDVVHWRGQSWVVREVVEEPGEWEDNKVSPTELAQRLVDWLKLIRDAGKVVEAALGERD